MNKNSKSANGKSCKTEYEAGEISQHRAKEERWGHRLSILFNSYWFLAIRLSQHFLKASSEVCLFPFAMQLSRENIMKKDKRSRLEWELTVMVAVVISASSFSISLPIFLLDLCFGC